jgi:hypothetical protein
MNHLQYQQYKQIDESYRKRMVAEFQTEKLFQQYGVYHPGVFEKAMFKLGNWMISRGRQILRRYEIPSANCSPTVSRDLI